jgi:hypothetical protein
MKKSNRLAVASALLSVVVSSHSAWSARDDLATFFDEDTMLYVEIPSVPQLREDWKANPFYELYQREEVKEFIDGMVATLMEEEEFKNNWDSAMNAFSEDDGPILEGLLTGQIAIGVTRLDFLSLLPNPMLTPEQKAARKPASPNFWIIFDHDDDDMKDKLIEDMEEEEDEYIEYEGFYIILADEIFVAYNDDIVAVTNTEESAITFVDRYLHNDSRPTLADSETFQNGFSRLYEDSEIFYYADLKVIGDLAEEAASEYAEMTGAMVENGQLAPTETILKALGLETFRGLTGSLDLDPSELKANAFVDLEPNEGFFGKLIEHYGYSLPDTRFLGEDLSQASASSFDISGMLHDLETTIAIISPFAGQMYAAQKAQFGQTLSIDIDQALIDNFSGSLYVAAGETPNTAAQAMAADMPGMESYFDQGNTIILGINDRLSLEALFDSLIATFNQTSLITKQDYLGVSNYALQTPEPRPGPAVFISDQHLIFEQTNPDFAKLIVVMMQNPGKPLFERRDVQDAFNALPPDPVGITFNDAEKLLAFMSRFFKNMTDQVAAMDKGEEDNPFSQLKIPVIEDFSYFTLGINYKLDGDLHQEIIMRPKTD